MRKPVEVQTDKGRLRGRTTVAKDGTTDLGPTVMEIAVNDQAASAAGTAAIPARRIGRPDQQARGPRRAADNRAAAISVMGNAAAESQAVNAPGLLGVPVPAADAAGGRAAARRRAAFRGSVEAV